MFEKPNTKRQKENDGEQNDLSSHKQSEVCSPMNSSQVFWAQCFVALQARSVLEDLLWKEQDQGWACFWEVTLH